MYMFDDTPHAEDYCLLLAVALTPPEATKTNPDIEDAVSALLLQEMVDGKPVVSKRGGP